MLLFHLSCILFCVRPKYPDKHTWLADLYCSLKDDKTERGGEGYSSGLLEDVVCGIAVTQRQAFRGSSEGQ